MAKTSPPLLQPSVRCATVWSPALVKAALIQADSGQFRTLADLCDWILADDRVGAVCQTFVGGVLGLPITFEPSGDGRRKGRAVKALEAEEDWWKIVPEDEAFQIYSWARLMGFQWAHLEHVTQNGRVLPCLRFWHSRNVRFDWETRKWFTRVGDAGHEVEMVDGGGEWVLFAPYGRFRPWAHGLWRGTGLWCLLKSYARDDWGRHGEKASTLVAESPQGTSPEFRKALVADLYSIGRNAVAAPPGGVKLQLLEATANTRDIYLAQVEAANTAIAVSWLGQNLTTEVKEGSFAAAQIHGRIEGQRIRAFCEFEATTVRERVLTRWAELNFGNRDLAPWPVRNTEVPEDGKVVAEIAKTRAEAYAAMKTAGVTIDPEEWFERGQLKILEVKEPEPPPAPPPGPPAPAPDAAQGAEGDDQTDEPAPPAKAKQAKALASGFEPMAAAGFIEGQSYADALADHGVRRGAQSIHGFLGELLGVVDGIESLDDARAKVTEFYRDALPPEELANRAEKLFVLGQLGGVLAVRQDVPELKDDDP